MATVPQFPAGTLSRSALNTFVTETTTNITDANIAAGANIAISKTTLGTYTAPTTWVPTITPGAGAFTTVTTNSARYTQIGKRVIADLSFTITNKGTGTGEVKFTLPVTSIASPAYSGSGFDGGGSAEVVQPSTTTIAKIVYYNGTSIIADASTHVITVSYEAA